MGGGGWGVGVALSLCIAGLLDICDPEDKLRRVSYWGSHSSFPYRSRLGPHSPWDQKQPE